MGNGESVRFKFNLGDEVQCSLTGFRGVVYAQTRYDTGEINYAISPKIGDDGAYPAAMTLDERRLELVDKEEGPA